MHSNKYGTVQIFILVGFLVVAGAVVVYKYQSTSNLDGLVSFFDKNVKTLDLPTETVGSQLESAARNRAQDLVTEYASEQVIGAQSSYDEITGIVKGDLSKAAKYATQKSTPLVKTDSDYYLDVGDSHAEEGDYEKAEDNYEKYVELEPNSVEGYCALSTLYQEKGDFEKAKELLQKAVGLLK
jgi:tetratricopeptide (TPR) repeat protein